MNKKIVITLILILILGAFLSLYKIGSESFWLDESSTAITVKYSSPLEILKNGLIYGNVKPGYWEGLNHDLPFYFVLLAFWVKLFGISEFTLRAFSALFGSLSILIVYLIARKLISEKVALLSSFLFSLSINNIVYSQEARLYAFLSFIALCSVYFYIKSFETGKVRYWLMLSISNIAGLYTHFVFIFFVSFEFVYIIIMFKEKYIRRILASLLLVGVSYLTIIPKLFNETQGAASFLNKPTIMGVIKFWFMFNAWIFPTTELRSNIYSQNFFQIKIVDWSLILSALLLVLGMTVFFVMGVFNSVGKLNRNHLFFKSFKRLFKFRYFTKSKWMLLLLFWFFVPLSLEFLLSILHPTATIFGPVRYLIFILPAYLILVSIGISNLKKYYSTAAIILFVLFSILPLASYYNNIDKQQWREVAIFMKENLKSNEIVMINLPYNIAPFDYYYGKSNNVFGVFNTTQASKLSENKDKVWLILSFEKYMDPEGSIRKYLEKEYHLDREKEFFDIKILYFVK